MFSSFRVIAVAVLVLAALSHSQRIALADNTPSGPVAAIQVPAALDIDRCLKNTEFYEGKDEGECESRFKEIPEYTDEIDGPVFPLDIKIKNSTYTFEFRGYVSEFSVYFKRKDGNDKIDSGKLKDALKTFSLYLETQKPYGVILAAQDPNKAPAVGPVYGVTRTFTADLKDCLATYKIRSFGFLGHVIGYKGFCSNSQFPAAKQAYLESSFNGKRMEVQLTMDKDAKVVASSFSNHPASRPAPQASASPTPETLYYVSALVNEQGTGIDLLFSPSVVSLNKELFDIKVVEPFFKTLVDFINKSNNPEVSFRRIVTPGSPNYPNSKYEVARPFIAFGVTTPFRLDDCLAKYKFDKDGYGGCEVRADVDYTPEQSWILLGKDWAGKYSDYEIKKDGYNLSAHATSHGYNINLDGSKAKADASLDHVKAAIAALFDKVKVKEISSLYFGYEPKKK